MQNVSQNLLNDINCKYYDEDLFNEMAGSKSCMFSVLHCNLQSSFKNFGLLKANLSNMKHDFSVITISETGTSGIGILSNLFENYTFINKLPPSSKKGGVGIYIRNTCSFSRRIDLDFQTNLPIEDIWLEINDYIVGVIYRHPNYNIDMFNTLLEQAISAVKLENKSFIICGDINIDLLQTHINKNKLYLDLLLSNNIIPTITLPTRITDHSATIIDHINIYRSLNLITNKITCGNVFLDISDHLPNFVIIEDKMKLNATRRPFIRNINEKTIANFKARMSEVDWNEVLSETNVNTSYSLFIKKYLGIFNKCFPLRQIPRSKFRNKKWITKGLLVSIKHKNRLYRQYKKKPNCNRLKVAYRVYSNKLLNILRSSEKKYYTDLLLQNKANSKNLWNTYHQLMGTRKNKRSAFIPKLVLDNNTYNDNSDIANAFNKYFCEIGPKLAKSFPETNAFMKYLTHTYSHNMFTNPITNAELQNEISNLPVNKAPGLDEINANIVKHIVHVILLNPYVIFIIYLF